MKNTVKIVLIIASLLVAGCASTPQTREPNQVSTDFGKKVTGVDVQNAKFVKSFEGDYLSVSNVATGNRIEDAIIALSSDNSYIDLGLGSKVMRLQCNAFLTSCEASTTRDRLTFTDKLNINFKKKSIEYVQSTKMSSPCQHCYSETKYNISNGEVKIMASPW